MWWHKIEEHHSKVWNLVPACCTSFSSSKTRSMLSVKPEIDEITDRLQELSERKDGLGLIYIRTSTKPWKRPPSSCLLDGPVVGRDSDKAKIIEMLSRDHEHCTPKIHVLGIVGMAGVGKTTLAQLVFNDDNDVLKQFSPKVWVSVSDDFDIIKVTKGILESVTSKHHDLEEFNNIQETLSRELVGKRFLIVFDDVWNTCDYDLWTKMQLPFLVGALGSKMIVTTRDADVAKIVGATEIHKLEGLSNDDCCKVVEQHAFLNINEGIPPNFELFKVKVATKCSRLPLAAKTLGGLLQHKEMDEWEEILDNKLWSLADESGILPVLRLSYHYLPSNLNRCFAYCSILPNDYEFGEKQLILLWIAEGLVQKRLEENKQMEDLGADYFQELLSRSLFQRCSKNNSEMYVMHDLVGDLARWAAGETVFRFEDQQDGRCSLKVRYSSYIPHMFDGFKKFDAFYEFKRLRTFLPLPLSSDPNIPNFLTSKVTFDLLPSLQCLRTLSLNGYEITKLPNSIGKLKYLRYLDLSATGIRSLPDSISTLYNLQTLILDFCYFLVALPTNMKNLTNLRHLSNSSLGSLEGMPAQLSRLTNLRTLSKFVVGKDSESGLDEIGPLLHLQETLCLSRLENVLDAQDARRAKLISKEGIDVLVLEWCGWRETTGEIESDVLHMLQPHKWLKKLTIIGYGGLQFSTWIGDSLFSNMVLVRLQDCNNCQFLPPLGKLPSLKELYITGMPRVESVGLEFYGEGSLPFPLLETLEIENMQAWEGWLPCEQYDGIGVFPCLKVLSIKRCPKLKGRLPQNLDSLAKLVIVHCELLEVSIATYKQLRASLISHCKGVINGSEVGFEFMSLSNISQWRLFANVFRGEFTKIKSLKFGDCEELTPSWKNEDVLLQQLISLGHLVIEGNSQFSKLRKLGMVCKLEFLELRNCQRLLCLHHLVSLQELEIFECPVVVGFPGACLPESLKSIKIKRCNSLMYIFRDQIPASLQRIEIIRCKKLKSLLKEDVESASSSFSPLFLEEASCLEYLSIWDGPSLTSLSCKAQLPRGLKHLIISNCNQLESITDGFHNDTCLEEIFISSCRSLKCLPMGLCYLSSLQCFKIWDSGNLVSFPKGGFPRRASNLRQIDVLPSYKLEALPEGMHKLKALQILKTPYSASFLGEGFPLNLTSLFIWNLSSCKLVLERGLLYRLDSLRHLKISGEDPNLVSFPPDKENGMLLPKSLIKLEIKGFPNLRSLHSNGFQVLTSLQSLDIRRCPKVASIPDGLPLSVTQLRVLKCPLLKERCEPGTGRYWPKIAHIPYIQIEDDMHTE